MALRRIALVVIALACLELEPATGGAASCRGVGGCSLTLTFTGTIVPTVSMNVHARDGVLVAEWSCSGSSECGDPTIDRTAVAFYDANVLEIVLTAPADRRDPITARTLGGRFVWAGRTTGSLIAQSRKQSTQNASKGGTPCSL